MLADELYARPLGGSNFAQSPQKRTRTELIEFIAKRFLHCDKLPAHDSVYQRDRRGFPGSARVLRVGDDVSSSRTFSVLRKLPPFMKLVKSSFRRDAETRHAR